MLSSDFKDELPNNRAKRNQNFSIHCPYKMPYEICRFQVTPSGVQVEVSRGLFHRQSQVKLLEHGFHCIDGYFNNPLCYFLNRTTDNENIQRKCTDSLKEVLMFCEQSWTLVDTVRLLLSTIYLLYS